MDEEKMLTLVQQFINKDTQVMSFEEGQAIVAMLLEIYQKLRLDGETIKLYQAARDAYFLKGDDRK